MRKPNLPAGHTENGKIMHRAQGQGVEPVTVGFTPIQLDHLDRLSALAGLNRSAYLRALVDKAVKDSLESEVEAMRAKFGGAA